MLDLETCAMCQQLEGERFTLPGSLIASSVNPVTLDTGFEE